MAAAADIPQILYNVPGRTASDIAVETVVALADVEQIVGIKDATGDLQRAKELIDKIGDRLAVYSGEDSNAYELILLGGKGNISVTANVAPALVHELCMLALDGRAEEARALNDRLMPLHRALFLEANPVPVKWAMKRLGKLSSGIRLPLMELDERYQPKLELAMANLELL